MTKICEYENAVMAALGSGHVSAEIRQHLRTCSECGGSELVWQYLTTVASQEKNEAPLPSADLIWWRAQLAEKRRLAARSIAAIELMQKAAIALVAGFLAVAAMLWGRDLFGSWALPLPIAIAALLFIAGLVSGIVYAWFQGHSIRVFARQR